MGKWKQIEESELIIGHWWVWADYNSFDGDQDGFDMALVYWNGEDFMLDNFKLTAFCKPIMCQKVEIPNPPQEAADG